jgi:hypothetical protein
VITLLGWIETGIIKNSTDNNRTKAPEMASPRTFPELFMILRGNCEVEKFLSIKLFFYEFWEGRHYSILMAEYLGPDRETPVFHVP